MSTGTTTHHHRPPPLPARRRPVAGRAGRGAGPRRAAQGRPVRRAPVGGPAGGRGAVRQAVHAHPGLVQRRRRRARRVPAGHRRPRHPDGPRRAGRRHRAGARPAGAGDRVADLRPGPDGGDGGRQPGAGRQRAHRRVPPVPDPRRPPDRGGAQGRHGGAHARVPRRRRQQHGALLPARRRDGRHARPGRHALHAPAGPGRGRRRRAGRRDHRRVGARHGRPGGGRRGRRRAGHRHLGVDGPRAREGLPVRDGEPVRAVRRRRRVPRPRRHRRDRAALPAGLPRAGDLRRRHRRPAVRRLGRGGEPAPRPEGAAGVVARAGRGATT